MAIRAVTFDVYSALYDTVSGLKQALGPLLQTRGAGGDPAALARVWRQRHMEYLLIANSLDRESARNRTALDASAGTTLAALRPPLSRDELSHLIDAWKTLPPWPDTVAVLTQVRRLPVILGTLSNGDADMLEALLGRLPVVFDRIISTEGGKFKPHPSVYAKALHALGVDRDDLLHIAGSATDAAGATAFGIRTVWVNRSGSAVLDPRFAPAYELPDLTGLSRILAHSKWGLSPIEK